MKLVVAALGAVNVKVREVVVPNVGNALLLSGLVKVFGNCGAIEMLDAFRYR